MKSMVDVSKVPLTVTTDLLEMSHILMVFVDQRQSSLSLEYFLKPFSLVSLDPQIFH